MNQYEQKQENRRERYLALADKLERASASAYKQARDMASVIPLGQPILIGHHSEKRDRNYRARIWRTQDRCLELAKKAKYYREKAESVGSAGVSSDDPEALVKLRDRLAELRAQQALMVAANKIVRAFWKAGVKDAQSGEHWQRYLRKMAELSPILNESRAGELMRPDFCGRIGFPDYALTNNSGNMRRIEQRIKALEAHAANEERADREHECGAYRVVECFADNRVRVYFPGKPAEPIRRCLKRNGFKWSPTEGAWQRMLSNYSPELLTQPESYLYKELHQ